MRNEAQRRDDPLLLVVRCDILEKVMGDAITDLIAEKSRLESLIHEVRCEIAHGIGLSENYLDDSFIKRYGVTREKTAIEREAHRVLTALADFIDSKTAQLDT